MESSETPLEPETTGIASDGADAAATGVSDALGRVGSLFEHFARVANADSCIGAVQTSNGHTVIPVAAVSVKAGFGLAFGGGAGGDATAKGHGSGGGGGGGSHASARTVAVVDISDTGVSVKPILDWSRIALALLALIGLRMVSGFGRKRVLNAIKSE